MAIKKKKEGDKRDIDSGKGYHEKSRKMDVDESRGGGRGIFYDVGLYSTKIKTKVIIGGRTSGGNLRWVGTGKQRVPCGKNSKNGKTVVEEAATCERKANKINEGNAACLGAFVSFCRNWEEGRKCDKGNRTGRPEKHQRAAC